MFGRLPKAKIEVKPTEAFREATASGAEYNQGTPDGSRPGVVMVNTGDFEKRTTINIETTAYHEGRAGPSHADRGSPQELPTIPPVPPAGRQHGLPGGLGPHWRTSGATPGSSRIPTSSTATTRTRCCARSGWWWTRDSTRRSGTREQVVQFFHDHSGTDEVEVQSETDRYISWPAQALGYKVGQPRDPRAPEKAKKELGPGSTFESSTTRFWAPGLSRWTCSTPGSTRDRLAEGGSRGCPRSPRLRPPEPAPGKSTRAFSFAGREPPGEVGFLGLPGAAELFRRDCQDGPGFARPSEGKRATPRAGSVSMLFPGEAVLLAQPQSSAAPRRSGSRCSTEDSGGPLRELAPRCRGGGATRPARSRAARRGSRAPLRKRRRRVRGRPPTSRARRARSRGCAGRGRASPRRSPRRRGRGESTPGRVPGWPRSRAFRRTPPRCSRAALRSRPPDAPRAAPRGRRRAPRTGRSRRPARARSGRDTSRRNAAIGSIAKRERSADRRRAASSAGMGARFMRPTPGSSSPGAWWFQ
jgi:hypothetical protein